MDKITENGQVNAVVSCVAIPKFFVNFHKLDTGGGGGGGGGSATNYLGSPFSASFNVTQIYNPPTHNGIDIFIVLLTVLLSTVVGKMTPTTPPDMVN